MHEAPPIELGIVLAAGASTRMGQPKALLNHGGAPLVNAHIRAFGKFCGHIIVVTGAHHRAIQRVLESNVHCIRNPDWENSHMSDSLRLAIGDGHGLAMVTPVDCPPAPQHVLEALTQVQHPAVCTFEGKDGHPVVTDMDVTRQSNANLREVLKDAIRVPTQWPGALENWNTPDDIRAYVSLDSSERS